MAATATSLYIGDLDPTVTEMDLSHVLSLVAPVDSVRLCRDCMSGASLCYAYVNFRTHSDALEAIKVLNHYIINGKPIRVMWSQRNPLLRKNGVGNLFVKNLNLAVDGTQLEKIFGKFGSILSCKVPDEKGIRKGFGFVQFDTEEASESALKELDGTVILGKKICISKFVKKSERHSVTKDPQFNNLYVKNIDDTVREDLVQEFSKHGTVTSIFLPRDENGKLRGFGFVTFESTEDARKAMAAMNGVRLGSKNLYVGRAQKKAEREQMLLYQFNERRSQLIKRFQGSNIYLKNLADSVDDEKLKEHFKSFGRMFSAKVMRDVKGKSRGFGFVCFTSPEEANRAIAACRGAMFHSKPLYVGIAQRKEERHSKLQLLFASGNIPQVKPATTNLLPPRYASPNCNSSVLLQRCMNQHYVGGLIPQEKHGYQNCPMLMVPSREKLQMHMGDLHQFPQLVPYPHSPIQFQQHSMDGNQCFKEAGAGHYHLSPCSDSSYQGQSKVPVRRQLPSTPRKKIPSVSSG